MSRRRSLLAAVALLALGGAAWHWQSHLIGLGARWYLSWVASGEEASGSIVERRHAVARIHRALLVQPPDDAQVPELFDLVTVVSARVATGEIDLPWAAYVYTSYWRDLERDRRAGPVRRPRAEVEAKVEEYVQFYALQKRPDVPGMRLSDLTGAGGESFTVEEIEEAARQGKDVSAQPLPLGQEARRAVR